MLKVVVADDEEHICRLIFALVDWDAMGMEVVGFASNGIEAVDLVEKHHPSILITDIRMPGCDGMELIKQVKTSSPEIEVIIISGHAHFPYARTAIQYNVSNYLLKPINKTELNQSLLQIGNRIKERRNSESGLQRLVEQRENVKQQMRNQLISQLLEGTVIEPDAALLRERCGLEIEGDVFQVFCLKLDYDGSKLNESTMQLINDKVQSILQANLNSVCSEIVFSMNESMGHGILFFEHKKSDDIRRIIRDCLNQLVMQKSIFGLVEFTISLSEVKKDTQLLKSSLEESILLIQERLVTSTERIIESMSNENSAISDKALEKYIRMMLRALELFSEEEGMLALEDLRREVLSANHPRGADILELVLSAGSTLLIQVDYKNQKEIVGKFKNNCVTCGTQDALFDMLAQLQNNILEEMLKARESDVLRPIRLSKQYIRNHYNEQITLEEVSEIVGLSTSYFSALFKKETGEGFAKYLIGIRIEEAKQLLRESNLSIAAICKSVGYNDVKHFTHTFEKTTGLKPSAYRKLYG